MFTYLAFCFFAIVISAGSNVEGDEESAKLAWAVRKLVGNCSRAEYYGRSFYRVGKMGPRGPKGEPGRCDCDILNEGGIQAKLQAMEETITNMKFAYPEGFCLTGLKTGKIPDSAISASSIHPAAYCKITNARLDRFGAWCAASNVMQSSQTPVKAASVNPCLGGLYKGRKDDSSIVMEGNKTSLQQQSAVTIILTDNPPNQWVEVDLGRIRNITGVITQGQGNIRNPLLVEWVTAFKIEYGTRPGSRRSLIENGYTKIFSPVNFDPITKVVTRFPDPITARFVRIVPTAYHVHMSMRFDFIDC